MLASGSVDGTIKLSEAANGRELRVLRHIYSVHSVAFSPDGRMLASGGIGWGPQDAQQADRCCGTVKLWDPASGQELRTLSGYTNAIFSVAFSPDGRMLASGGTHGTIKL